MPKRNDGKSFEKRIAARTGGRITPGSGNGVVKEDVQTPDGWLVQAKAVNKREAKSYSIKFEDLDNLRFNAAMQGRLPRMEIEDPQGRVWVILPLEIFDAVRKEDGT